jgi:hypothetical protein
LGDREELIALRRLAELEAKAKGISINQFKAKKPSVASPEEEGLLKKVIGGAVEPNLTLATGALAAPLSGLAGIAGTMLPGEQGQGAEWARNVGSTLTYSPQTQGGKDALSVIAKPFELLGEGADWAGGKYSEALGKILPPEAAATFGAGLNTAIQAVPMALSAKYMPSIPKIGESAPVQAVSKVVKNIAGPIEGRAGRLLRDVAGPDKIDAVIQAMLQHQDRVPGSAATAGQAATPAGSAEMSALQEIIANRAPSKYGTAGIEGSQEGARQAAIGTIAKTPKDLVDAILARKEATAPIRETSLANANIAGVKGPQLAERIAERGTQATEAAANVRRLGKAGEIAERVGIEQPRLGGGAPPVPGLPRTPSQYSYGTELSKLAERKTGNAAEVSLQKGSERRFAQMQADSLAEHGYFPLESNSVVGQIKRIQNIPGNKTNTTLQKAMGEINDLIASATDRNGIIDSRELYTIRKSEAGNVINKFAQENKNWDQRYTAGLLKDVQKIIDKAIVDAGAPDWPKYLSTYGEMSKPINRMETGQAVKDALVSSLGTAERPTVFANLVKKAGEETSVGTGKPRMADLTPQEASVVEAVKAELARNSQYNKMASEGSKEATRRITTEIPVWQTHGFFSPGWSAARAIYNRVANRATDKVVAELANRMDNPQAIAKLMQDAAPAQRSLIVDALMRRANVGAMQQAAQQGER